MKFLLASLIVLFGSLPLVSYAAEQITHRRGHVTIAGELQVHYRQQPEVVNPTPLFWVRDVYIAVEPKSDLEKFLLAHVGTRIVVTVRPE